MKQTVAGVGSVPRPTAPNCWPCAASNWQSQLNVRGGQMKQRVAGVGWLKHWMNIVLLNCAAAPGCAPAAKASTPPPHKRVGQASTAEAPPPPPGPHCTIVQAMPIVTGGVQKGDGGGQSHGSGERGGQMKQRV